MTNTAIVKPKAQRYGSCDLLRFVFSLFIVGNHIYQIGLPGEPFAAARIFVEFFFMVSGFFMIQKYENSSRTVTVEESAKEAFYYTWRKWKSLMYYVLPCIVLEYVLRICSTLMSTGNFAHASHFVLNLPLELSMLAPLTYTRYLVPIWYISAMLITMPLLCFVYLRFRSAFIYIFSWLIPVVYFFLNDGIHPTSHNFDALLRAYCDMSMGCFIYFLARYVSRMNFSKFMKFALTVVEFFCFAVPIVFVSMKNEEQYNLITLLFVIGITIMMSRVSYSAKINGGFFSYLGKISLPIYTVHWFIGSVVWLIHGILNGMGYPIPMSLRVVMFYSFSIIAAIIFCFIVDKIKNRKLEKKVK
ncbi:MAG: acyltransferase [Ruminococcus sp.]|nr:acyltransferase [Ruminococcus sp.]